MSRLFGTDGIRGVANEPPLTPDLAYRVGRELAATLAGQHGVERASGSSSGATRAARDRCWKSAMVAGLLSAGADCYTVGVLPTPGHRAAHARARRARRASCSPPRTTRSTTTASSCSRRRAPSSPTPGRSEIEARLAGADRRPAPRGAAIGRLVAYDRAEQYYVDFLTRCFPLDLGGMTIVLDCAHGATYRVAPRVFRRPGRPRGDDVRAGRTGPTSTPAAARCIPRASRRARAGARAPAVGFAFDGDGDRLISVDHTGEIRDGDYVLAIAAPAPGRARAGSRPTSWSPRSWPISGSTQSLREAGIDVVKTQVGDRYVREEMQRLGANLGGEQSGHLLFLDHAPRGDGILSALALLARRARDGRAAGVAGRLHAQVPPGPGQRARRAQAALRDGAPSWPSASGRSRAR